MHGVFFLPIEGVLLVSNLNCGMVDRPKLEYIIEVKLICQWLLTTISYYYDEREKNEFFLRGKKLFFSPTFHSQEAFFPPFFSSDSAMFGHVSKAIPVS